MGTILELQELDAQNDLGYGDSNYGGASNLSLLAACAQSTVSLLTCQ
ncbi:SapB/AmfS family lanthipeptide [Saccharopolyspora sp. ASAGF58]|nr:SapB/AmfS family lanthipeptide [Saccharopolyspora sp. ASAGF58]QIZ39120.1 SapB/AmfS family lantipeptide [Saccharopolyspora sp. ASAGF58]